MVTSTNVLLSAYTSFLRHCCFVPLAPHLSVSMPSRAYTSFLRGSPERMTMSFVNVSMPSRAYTSFLRPTLGLSAPNQKGSVNALSGLYLISTAADNNHNTTAADNVSMPSRAYTSFLRYPFKNLGFMRFPEPVFAGIYQNILTAAVFRAC